MPELPEVETARRHIAKHCLNKKLVKVDFVERGGHAREGLTDEIIVDESLLSENGAELCNRVLVNTHRKGKYIVWEFNKPGKHLVFHFGMTGNFRIKGVQQHIKYYESSSIKPKDATVEPRAKKLKKDAEEAAGNEEEIYVDSTAQWPPRFTKALFYFEDNIIVAFTDPRRLGRLQARENPLHEEPIKALAADPIHEMPSIESFKELVSQAGTREIKTVLLDQNRIVCGIGNYLADECLHQACIHPCQRVHELTEDEVTKLRECILDVCTTACNCLDEKRDFPTSWLFHGRWDPKKDREKNPERLHIEELKVGGRTTLFDPERQILRKGSSTKTKKVGASRSVDDGKKKTKSSKANGKKNDTSTSPTKAKTGSPKKKGTATEQTQKVESKKRPAKRRSKT